MTLRLRGKRRLLPAAVLALALVHAGCGVNPVTGESEPARSIIEQREWALGPLEILAVDIGLNGVGSGTLDATAEWTVATDDVDLYVTAMACTPEMFANESCAYRAKADSPTIKPERVSFNVSGGDRYRFWIVNLGPQRESGTLVVGLTQ